jgi:hypothetical protein
MNLGRTFFLQLLEHVPHKDSGNELSQPDKQEPAWFVGHSILVPANGEEGRPRRVPSACRVATVIRPAPFCQ